MLINRIKTRSMMPMNVKKNMATVPNPMRVVIHNKPPTKLVSKLRKK